MIAPQAPVLLQHIAAVGMVDAVGGCADGFGEKPTLAAIAMLDVAPCVMRRGHTRMLAPHAIRPLTLVKLYAIGRYGLQCHEASDVLTSRRKLFL